MGLVVFYFFTLVIALLSQAERRTIRAEFADLIEGGGVAPDCLPLRLKRHDCPADIHAVVASPGGSGSTHVLRLAGKALNVNKGNKEYLKHTTLPPYHNPIYVKGFGPRENVPEVDYDRFKAFYVFGDPMESLASFFRRKFYRKQHSLLTAKTCRIGRLDKKIRDSTSVAPQYLESYSKKIPFDRFRLNENYLHWFFDETPYDRIFIDGSLSEDVLDAFPICPLAMYPFSSSNRPTKIAETPNCTYYGDMMEAMKNAKTTVKKNFLHPRHIRKYHFSDEMTKNMNRPFLVLQAFFAQLPPIFVRPKTQNTKYAIANATTFKERLSHKFIGDFDMDELLDTLAPELSPLLPDPQPEFD